MNDPQQTANELFDALSALGVIANPEQRTGNARISDIPSMAGALTAWLDQITQAYAAGDGAQEWNRGYTGIAGGPMEGVDLLAVREHISARLLYGLGDEVAVASQVAAPAVAAAAHILTAQAHSINVVHGGDPSELDTAITTAFRRAQDGLKEAADNLEEWGADLRSVGLLTD